MKWRSEFYVPRRDIGGDFSPKIYSKPHKNVLSKVVDYEMIIFFISLLRVIFKEKVMGTFAPGTYISMH